MKEIIFFQGRFMPVSQARVSVLEATVLQAKGIFETMRAYQGKIVYLQAHLKRLEKSSALLGIKLPYSLPQLQSFIRQIISLNRLADARLRLTLWQIGQRPACLIVAERYHPYSTAKYKQGFSLYVSRFRQSAGSFLAGIKTTSRLLYELAYAEAREQGCDEALLLNNRGYLCEASRSNLFFVQEGELFTPALGCGCLDGITRHVVFSLAKKQKIKLWEGNFIVSDLARAEEACLTNSLIGIMPLKDKCGKIIRLLQGRYNCLLG
jgi:branched-subunit amino acid aminotransferase/4-amino-4-deoxychorismate lyase